MDYSDLYVYRIKLFQNGGKLVLVIHFWQCSPAVSGQERNPSIILILQYYWWYSIYHNIELSARSLSGLYVCGTRRCSFRLCRGCMRDGAPTQGKHCSQFANTLMAINRNLSWTYNYFGD